MATSKLYTLVRKEGQLVFFKSSDYLIAEVEGETSVLEGPNQDFLIENVEGYSPEGEGQNNTSTTSNNDAQNNATPPALLTGPHDPRLVFVTGTSNNSSVLSFSATAAKPLVDGFIFPEDPNNSDSPKKSAASLDDIETRAGVEQFAGVPSIMNPNAYIGFQQFKGSKDQNYLARLIDQENQPRWYEVDQENAQKAHRYKSPTVSELVAWSQEPDNVDRKPYRFQDFAYCKYWQKIPNNYLITLRRFPFPTSDNLEADGENHPKGEKYKPEMLRPVAQAVTWLGESSGNKISSILGNIESGLNWKEITAEINMVTPGQPGSAGAGPLPGVAKWLGLLDGSSVSPNNNVNTNIPPDPYTDGPWNNKVIGGLNVINSVKARERGLKFEHKIELVFEYEARSIGGINTKAAMLDIMSNLLVLTSATASFWGGANRFRPGSVGDTAPFLGGKAGRAAWLRGDPVGFLDAVAGQFTSAANAISDFFSAAMQDPIGSIKSLISGGASMLMKDKIASHGSAATGMKAILTGEPVGEWHLTVGNPFNPMMMIGNLICTGIKFEFNDELGPDDFPTELKATISLEHGKPRDRDAIEAMFNGGGGRLYSLPPDYEKNLSSSNMTAVDKYTKKGEGGESNRGAGSKRRRSALLGDPQDVDRAANIVQNTGKNFSTIAAKWGLGYTSAKDTKTNTSAN
jgi:hypothetical protein